MPLKSTYVRKQSESDVSSSILPLSRKSVIRQINISAWRMTIVLLKPQSTSLQRGERPSRMHRRQWVMSWMILRTTMMKMIRLRMMAVSLHQSSEQ
jgi:hypothetical protein